MKIPINIEIDASRIYANIGPGEHPIEPESSKSKHSGFLTQTKQGLQLSYKENEEDDMGDTTTTISTLGENVISVNRVGMLNSHMVFEEGKCHTCVYDTGVFPMQLRVCTKELKNSLSPMGGKLDIDYSVEIVGSLAEQNRLSVSIYPDESIITS